MADESISIVIAVYNEEESLPVLYKNVKAVMERLSRPYEIIFVDDGSRDKSMKLLEDMHSKDERVIVVSFRKNFGQTAAIAAGFEYAKGDIVVTMDADLQNDPEDIPMMLEKIKDFDVVSGWRKRRQDKFISRRLPSMVANRIISWVTECVSMITDARSRRTGKTS